MIGMKNWYVLFLFFLSLSSWGASELASTVTVDGQLFQDNTGTNPLLDSSARLRLQILNGDKTCVLYEEQQYVDTTLTKGAFSIQLGSEVGAGKRVAGNDPGNSMVAVYQNTVAIPATGCAGNSSPAVAYSKRYIRVYLLKTGGVEEALNPDIELGSMPMASVAQTLQGYSASNFLILGSGDLTQTALQNLFVSGSASKLSSIVSGYGSNGTWSMPSSGAAPGSLQAGQIWYDSVTNKVKFYDGTTTQVLGSSGTGVLSAADGGTGQSSYTVGDILYASSGTALSRLSAGASGRVLTSAGAGLAPTWSTLPSSVGGSGTTGKYAKFTASGTVGDSLLSESGSAVTVGGSMNVSGPIVSTPTSGALTNFNFSTGGNVQYTSSACQAMTLAGMADGGSYSVAVQNSSGACSFTHSGLTVRLAGGVSSVTITTHTVFTFIRAGSYVYATWVTF